MERRDKLFAVMTRSSLTQSLTSRTAYSMTHSWHFRTDKKQGYMDETFMIKWKKACQQCKTNNFAFLSLLSFLSILHLHYYVLSASLILPSPHTTLEASFDKNLIERLLCSGYKSYYGFGLYCLLEETLSYFSLFHYIILLKNWEREFISIALGRFEPVYL